MSICFVCFVFLLYFTCITWQTNTKRRMLELFRIDGGQKGLGIFLVSYIGFCNWSLCWNSSMQLNRNLVCRSKRLLRTCFQSGTAALRFRNVKFDCCSFGKQRHLEIGSFMRDHYGTVCGAFLKPIRNVWPLRWRFDHFWRVCNRLGFCLFNLSAEDDSVLVIS